MPVPLNVPPHQRAAIVELASLNAEAYGALRDLLEHSGPLPEPTPLVERVSKALQNQTRLGGQILGMVIGLRGLVDRSALSVNEIAESVSDDVVETKKWIGAESTALLKQRLAELLEMKSVAISSKAFSLSVADESPFSDCRIVSDIRPLFSGADGELELTGSVIVHHLVMEVGGAADDKYVALSTSDLLKLKRTIERAVEKDRKLRKALTDGPIVPLETDDLINKPNA